VTSEAERAAWRGARRVLAVRLDAAGDVVMTGPALQSLQRGADGRRVTLLTSQAGAHAARLLPGVDEVIEYAAPWMKAARPPDPAPDLAMIERLRGRFDAAVIFTVYSQSALPAALLCTLAGIPLRAAHCRENPYGLLTTWLREPEPEQLVRHEVDRQLALVEHLGGTSDPAPYRLRIPETARAAVEQLRARLGLSGREPWALLHPGASAPSRRYAPEAWGAVARSLVFDHGWRLVLAGGEDDAGIVSAVASATGVDLPVVLGLPLSELAALIEAAPLLLAVNSLAAHLASASGTPVVDVYALTNPQHVPWNGVPRRVLNHDVPCRNCYRSECPLGHHACLALLDPAEVTRAALDLRAEVEAEERYARAR
jgi:ADP-heptose:LPS heptosyltransferase